MAKAFGTAGVRGVFNRTQTPEQVYRLAEAVAFSSGKGGYAVGWDGRKASALLARTVCSAVLASGSDARSFGVVPTPVVAYGTRSRGCLMGFSVTASHNPAEFSGVKVFNPKGMEIPKSDEERIERAMAVDVMKASGRFGENISDPEVSEEYLEALVSRRPRAKEGLSIAVDCAGGPGGNVTPQVLKAMGHRVVPVNAQISWRFTARPPEPTPVNLTDFCRVVPGLGVDFGFAHDGDADRLVMVDPLGNVVPDSILTILALRAVRASTGVVVLSENTSTAVSEEAERMGLRVVRSRVGKTFAILESEGGVFASEPSKIVDPSWGLWEDGMNAAAMVAGLLTEDLGLLGRMSLEVQWKYRQVNVEVGANMARLIEDAREAYRKLRIVEERTLDGHKFVFADGSWAMFRTSGTEPKTRLYAESKDAANLEFLVQQGVQCIESAK